MFTLHGTTVRKLEESDISTIFLVNERREVEFSYVDEDGYRGVTLEGYDGFMNVKDKGLHMERFAAILCATVNDLEQENEVDNISDIRLTYMGEVLHS
jgi:hypothetical protein